MNWIKEQAKTIAAFVAAFVGNVIVSLINGTTAIPTTKADWIQYLVTSVGAAFAAWLARNKVTQKQIDKDPNVIGTVYENPPTPEAVAKYTPPAVPVVADGQSPWIQ